MITDNALIEDFVKKLETRQKEVDRLIESVASRQKWYFGLIVAVNIVIFVVLQMITGGQKELIPNVDNTVINLIVTIALPFILMRHWDEWQEKKTLTMDDKDRRLYRLAMDIQYRCQHFFFGEMAHSYFENQNKEFVQHRRSSRYSECFSKLPEEFKAQQFMEVFGCSQPATSRAIARFQSDGVAETVHYGLYRKLVNELP